MTLLEDIGRARAQGIQDDQIVQMLRDQGVQYRDIADVLAQSRIQEAVASPDEMPQPLNSEQEQNLTVPMAPQDLSTQNPAQELSAPAPSPDQTYPAQDYAYPEGYGPQYGQYPQQSDNSLLNEIAEQVVAEKMSDTQRQIEKLLDIKTIIQSKVESLDDRLKRIEKIIDTLQSSVLKKVGDYVTNVEDIKKELIETQKTFANISSHANVHAHAQNQSHSHKTKHKK